jgi:hypothetical protein
LLFTGLTLEALTLEAFSGTCGATIPGDEAPTMPALIAGLIQASGDPGNS